MIFLFPRWDMLVPRRVLDTQVFTGSVQERSGRQARILRHSQMGPLLSYKWRYGAPHNMVLKNMCFLGLQHLYKWSCNSIDYWKGPHLVWLQNINQVIQAVTFLEVTVPTFERVT